MKKKSIVVVILVLSLSHVASAQTKRVGAETRNSKEYADNPGKSVKQSRRKASTEHYSSKNAAILPSQELIEKRRKRMTALENSKVTAIPEEE